MCRLKVKLRIIGKKNQEFVRFILVPKNIRQRGKYLLTLGYWDTRKNNKIRHVVFNIYKFMYYYRFGATANKKALRHIFLYFVKRKLTNNGFYFNDTEIRLFVENDIIRKYNLKKK
jgi:ribosomal protein S16